ncbi:MAG: hypothetical protein ACW99R_15475 [Candidatus Hodarchaeales archaeon]|jgi:hypothetical protein
MTSIYSKKQRDSSFEPMCLEGPKNKNSVTRRQIFSLLFPLIVVILLIPPVPPPVESEHILSSFPLNQENSTLIPSRVIIYDLIETKDNGYAILCEESSFEGLTSLMLLKTNQLGELQWSRSYGFGNWTHHSDQSVVQTLEGGYAIAGAYNGIRDSVDGQSSIGYSELWVIKTDQEGVIQWQKTYYRHSSQEIGLFGFLSTADGGMVLGGSKNTWEEWTYWYIDREITATTWLVKLDSLGSIQWDRNLFTKYDWIDGRENFLTQTTTGEFVYASSNNYVIQITKINKTGTIKWNNNHRGNGEQIRIKNLQMTTSEEFVLIYRSAEGGGANIKDVFGIAKIATDGKLMWRKAYDLPQLLGSLWEQDPISNVFFFYTDNYPCLIDNNELVVAFHYGGGDSRSYMVKFTLSGERKWSKKLENIEITHILNTTDENMVLAGHNSYSTKHATAIIMKYDLQGTGLWFNQHSIPADDEWATSLGYTNSGELVIAGTTNALGNGKTDGFMVVMDPINKPIWRQKYGGAGEDTIEKIYQTSDDGYLLGGSTDSFGAGGFDMWLVRTDSYGKVIWNQTYGGEGNEWCEDLIQTPDQGYFIVGSSNSSSSGFYEVFLVKIDEKGVQEWNQTYTSTQFGYEENQAIYASIVVQNEDQSYLLGTYTGRTPLQGDFTSGSVALTRIDTQGNVQWNQVYLGYFVEDYYKISGIIQINDGYIFMGESFLHCSEYCHPTGYAPFLIRTDENGGVEWNQTYQSYLSYSIGKSSDYGGKYDDNSILIFPGMKHAFISTLDGGYMIGFGNWLLKTDEKGIIEWNQSLLDNNQGQGYTDLGIYTVIPTEQNELIFAGTVSPVVTETGSSLDIWVTKISQDGYSDWQLILGFEENTERIETGNADINSDNKQYGINSQKKENIDVSAPGGALCIVPITLVVLLSSKRYRKKK